MRKSIKDTVSNPADALEAMVKGLENQDERTDFGVDLSTFGRLHYDNLDGDSTETCFGCAATCALQEIAGINLTEWDIEDDTLRAQALNLDLTEFCRFESAIDRARSGSMYELWHFFGIDRELEPQPTGYAFPTLDNDWKAKLPAVKAYIAELRRIQPEWA